MARKKTKLNSETSSAPTAEGLAAAPVATTAGDAVAGDAVTETNLPVARTASPRATKKPKKAPAPKASMSQGRTAKAGKGNAPTIQEEAAKPRKLSALDAAAKMLEEAGQPMNCQEMIAAMAAKGYWSSPAGKTPAATLYSALLNALWGLGDNSRG